MTDLAMKDYTSYMVEKPFFCDVDGCTMRFTNEDHLTVHKKRHDMVLNLGLGHKGNTFVDQTPTPTSFIRNCEEVGLFQDLQNVNPFEETFKKAAEAVKTGQTPCMERLFQSNPPDDTLHTPNVFPLITDPLPCSKIDEVTCLPSKTIDNSDDFCDKKYQQSDINLVDKDFSIVQKDSNEEFNSIKNSTIIEQSSHKKKESDDVKDAMVLGVPNIQIVEATPLPPCPPLLHCGTPPEQQGVEQKQYNMVVLNNISSETNFSSSIKKKLKQSISGKTSQVPKLKIPIPKAPRSNTSTSVVDKFSTFKKNSLKFISQIQNTNNHQGSPKRLKNSQSSPLKGETRSEFLARNRAAATRCRERKKLYVSCLEKQNKDLIVTNQTLKYSNMSLRKQIYNLQCELLRHKNCDVADENTKMLLRTPIIKPNDVKSTLKNHFENNAKVGKPNAGENSIENEDEVTNEQQSNLHVPKSNRNTDSNCDITISFVEVTLNNTEGENDFHIPLDGENRAADIIVRFNNSKSDFIEFQPDLFPIKLEKDYIEHFKQIYNEHCYFVNGIKSHVKKKSFNLNAFGSVNDNIMPELKCKGISNQVDSKENTQTSSPNLVVNSKIIPQVILRKPFKKRSLSSKQSEKS